MNRWIRRRYEFDTYMETKEAVRLLMKKSECGAKCILDCVMNVEAEFDGEPQVDVKAYVQGSVIGKIDSGKANEAAPPPMPLASAVVYAPIFLGGVPNTIVRCLCSTLTLLIRERTSEQYIFIIITLKSELISIR